MSFFNSIGRSLGRSGERKKSSKAPPIPNMPSSETSFQNYAPGSAGGGGQNSMITRQMPGGSVKPLFMCRPFINAQLLKGNFKTIVVLPKYVDKGEWLALNMFEFYEYLKLFNSVIFEFCQTCPTMSAGPGTEYYWVAPDRKPTPLPAAQYINNILGWIFNKLNDESLFPIRPANAITGAGVTTIPSPVNTSSNATTWVGKEGGFPQQFLQECRSISKQMFRVFAHIYHSHFDKICHLSLEAHLNSFFAHFVNFTREFELLDKRDMEPLKELIESYDERGLIVKS